MNHLNTFDNKKKRVKCSLLKISIKSNDEMCCKKIDTFVPWLQKGERISIKCLLKLFETFDKKVKTWICEHYLFVNAQQKKGKEY